MDTKVCIHAIQLPYQHPPASVMRKSGEKVPAQVSSSSSDRGSKLRVQKEVKQSLLYCMSDTGVFVPPVLILSRKRMNPLLYKDAPNGTLPLISDTGYMNSHLFIDWLKHFIKHVKPSAEDPVLLIADNYTSHFSFPVVLFCRENHITFLTLPPHSSHVVILAPLDKDCTVAIAPEEDEVSPSTSQIDVSIQSIVPLPRHEQRGAKRKRKFQKSKIMTSSPFKNLLEKNKKEKVKLEEAKANLIPKKNKNGDKTEKGKDPSKEKTHSEFYQNPVPSTSSANNEGTICPGCERTCDEDWILCGLCKEWWHEECSSYEGSGAFVCDYC
ncbi:hypothetical protein AVEN_263339-1 [Araneus ventricosus]|uniref:DDE-1 domain-containing protein n=1 Tax=Araneus ventricosus TaxID=182803 RepID=A0A4Y2D190_ARAVE|nr:hypothetical protein AVEN_263339-1 [Araneus ventricosus]